MRRSRRRRRRRRRASRIAKRRARTREKPRKKERKKKNKRDPARVATNGEGKRHSGALPSPSFIPYAFFLFIYIYIFFFSSFFCLFASPHRTEAIVRPEDRTWRVEWPLNAVRVRRSFSFSLSLLLYPATLYRVARNTRSAIRER